MNPYDQYLIDDASGQSTLNPEWMAWQRGYNARISDEIEESRARLLVQGSHNESDS